MREYLINIQHGDIITSVEDGLCAAIHKINMKKKTVSINFIDTCEEIEMAFADLHNKFIKKD